jgi:hypothetical protein
MADMDPEEVRTMALALPDAVEEPHFDSASFRVGDRIFLALPVEEDGAAVAHVFLDEHEVHRAVAEYPNSCEELWWGKQLSGVRVHLARAEAGQVEGLVVEAWRSRAPRRLAATLDEGGLLARGPRRGDDGHREPHRRREPGEP